MADIDDTEEIFLTKILNNVTPGSTATLHSPQSVLSQFSKPPSYPSSLPFSCLKTSDFSEVSPHTAAATSLSLLNSVFLHPL